jgi:EAL domain-containing protein (putative c-di-GMP-specific phosphodiesterase class I)/FixJ family two-component response regulator/GGDEF domain-containing protein
MTERYFDSDFETTRRLLERLNRLYSMLSRINRTIVRAESPNDIYGAACRIAVEDGNLGFALIGLVEPQGRQLVTVASAGAAPDLTRLPLAESGQDEALHDDAERIYPGRSCIINDIRTDPRAAPTRDMLEEIGIRAFASFPLLLEKAVVGILAVGIGEADYFGDPEVHLLEEVADDISFAMDVLRRDEKRLAGEAKMHYLAFYDSRTGLPGRALFEERLIATCEQRKDHIVAVLAINLRRYHGVLDVLGQEAGVTIARAVASRIETALPTAVVARIGESQLALVLDDLDGIHLVEEIAWRVHAAVAEGILIEGQEVFLDPFIGIALHPQDGSASEVLKAALLAAGKAPFDRSNSCRFFVAEMDRGSRNRLDLDTALRRAVTRKEFELYYQPEVDLTSGRVVGAEALLRWQRPNHGLVMPGEFIPMLEETGLICAVGEWALFEACRTCKQWQDAGLPPVRMAVNLSARQFHETDVGSLVRRALHNSQLEPKWLELEVTESIILLDAETIIRTMRGLHAIGVIQTLDDFGTGYSSLSYLQRLPVQHLKIDRSFVSNITSNPNDAAIVRAVIGMAHSLGLGVIAEGVETEGQLGYLRGLSCEQMQGFYFSPAVTADVFVTILRDGRCIQLQAETPKRERILLILDDEPNILSALRRMLRHTDIRVLATTNPHEGFDLLAANPVGVVICDQRMPEMTGTEFLRRVKELYPATVRIVLSGYTDLNSVIDAVNRGAIYKFLTKPWQEDAMLESLEDAFRLHEIEHENQDLSKQLRDLRTAANGADKSACP